MNRKLAELQRFGNTDQERFDLLLKSAKELYPNQSANFRGWRWEFCKAIAAKKGQGAHPDVLYDAMDRFSSEMLTEIRIACIGKEASDEIMDRQKSAPKPYRAKVFRSI